MKPILLNHSQTVAQLVSDRTAGLGVLTEATSCIVTEERNGAFTLSMKLPTSAKHYEDLEIGGIIKAVPNDHASAQLFRINKISRPIGGIVTVSANHISYDLNKTSVAPFTATGVSTALTRLKTKMTGGAAFTFETDIVNTTSTLTNSVPQSARAILGGQEGSFLDTFGGELEFNNSKVILHASRGADRGVVLRYGKNITDIQQDENIESTYTAVMPYATDTSGGVVVGDLQTIIVSEEPRILNLDLTSKFSNDDPPTSAKLNTAAQAYITANNLTAPKVSIKVSFVNLKDTEEYKDIAVLERVQLCDTITVNFEKLGINATAKVITTKWDVLKERYEEIEIGDARSTLAKTISGISSSISSSTANAIGYLDGTIQAFTELIANGLGLFVTKKAVGADGAVQIYLHNRPQLADSQYQWTINASGFAVSQDYGATWSAGFDSSGNAVFNSLSANNIDAMNINGAVINGAQVVFDPDGNPVTARKFTAGEGGVIFTGNGDFTVSTHTIGLTANGQSGSERELQIVGKDSNGNNRNIIIFTDSELNIRHQDASGTTRSSLRLFDSQINLYKYGSDGTPRGSILTTDSAIDIQNYDSSGNSLVRVRLSQDYGLGIYLNGSGYGNLKFVDDGNGHSVLGV